MTGFWKSWEKSQSVKENGFSGMGEFFLNELAPEIWFVFEFVIVEKYSKNIKNRSK